MLQADVTMDLPFHTRLRTERVFAERRSVDNRPGLPWTGKVFRTWDFQL